MSTSRFFGASLRSWGRSLDAYGAALQGKYTYTEHLVPQTRVVPIGSRRPFLSTTTRVAPNASVIGHVNLEDDVAVWYGASVYGDEGAVSIGRRSAVQERAVVRASGADAVRIGSNVFIGPGALLTGCAVGDGAVVGANAIVNKGAVVEPGAYVAPGAVVAAGARVPAGEVWAGSPAARVETLSAIEQSRLAAKSAASCELAVTHAAEWVKTVEQVIADDVAAEHANAVDPEFDEFQDSTEVETTKRGLLFNQKL